MQERLSLLFSFWESFLRDADLQLNTTPRFPAVSPTQFPHAATYHEPQVTS